jgi:protein O-GlcNAcase/histone acetyltransferase
MNGIMSMAESPRPALAGVVEGFYGRPWTLGHRRQLFQWLAAAGLNTYLYAPKDDLKHRALWREPYAPEEAAELRRLVVICRNQRIQFLYALAPGLDITASDPADSARFLAKLGQVADLGATGFAVLWDDIPAQLGLADRARFGTPAAAQCAVTNAALASLKARGGPTRLLFCPTAYCGRMAQPAVAECPYLLEVGEKLDLSIDILWTGPHIVSEEVPVESIREVARVLRRQPILWDNLHANDYDLRRLYLGPYAGRSPELRAEIAGVLLNPNCQFEANFVPIHTLGQYWTQPNPPAPAEAHRTAVNAWLPLFASRSPHPLDRDQLGLLCDLFHLPGACGPQAKSYLEDVNYLLQTPPALWADPLDRFLATSQRLVTAYDRLTEIRDRDLLYALYPHVWEAKETALFLLAWVDWRRSNPDPDARFQSPDFRPGVFRGGFAAAVERRLRMDSNGLFHPAALTSMPSVEPTPSGSAGIPAGNSSPQPSPPAGNDTGAPVLTRTMNSKDEQSAAFRPRTRLRPALVADIPGAYAVCLLTGDSGKDGTHLYPDDPTALGELYVGPYIYYEPERAFVLEDDEGICGYVLGALDSAQFYRRMETEWLPRLCARHPDPAGPIGLLTPTQLLYREFHHYQAYYPPEFAPYPAHAHIDLAPRAQRHGEGRRMMEHLLHVLAAQGAPGVHLGLSSINLRAYGFYRHLGFEVLARTGPPADGVIYMGRKLPI